jgi:hypothetical protein
MNFRLPRFRSTRAMHTAVLACAPLLVTFTCSQFDVVASAQNAPAAKPTASKTSTFSFGLSHQAPSQSRNRQACHGQVTTPSRSGPVPSEAPMCGQRSSIAE